MENVNGSLAYKISLDTEKLKQDVEDVKNMLSGIATQAEREGSKMDKAFGNIGKTLAGVFTIKEATNFISQCIKVRGEVESLGVSFETLLGNKQKADDMLMQIREYAVKTPMQVSDLASAAQTMLAFNIEADKVMPTLKALGDISMGNAAKFQSLTLAFSQMSATGKLMGQDLLQMINAGFNPLSVISEKTGKSIATLKDEMSKGAISAEMVADAFISATSEGGKFNGMLEKQSHTINGAISNLQGAFADMMSSIGESIEKPTMDAVGAVTKLFQNYENVGKVLAEMVAIYGSYKAAVVTTTIVQKIATASTTGYTIANQIEYTWLLLVEKAQKILNATMMKNPYVLAATALMSIVSALILFSNRASDAEIAQNALNKAIEDSSSRQEEMRRTTDELLNIVTDVAKTDLQRAEAYKKLQSMYPDILENMTQETFLLKNQEAIKKSLANSQDVQETKKQADSIAQLKSDLEEIVKLQEKRTLYPEEYLYDVEKFLSKYRDAAKEAGSGKSETAVIRYMEAQLKALTDNYQARLKSIRETEFNSKPIEQRIEITSNGIDAINAEIATLQAKLTKEPWNLVIKTNIDSLKSQLQELIDKRNDLEGTKENKGTTLKDITKEIKDAQKVINDLRSQNVKDIDAITKAQTALDDAKKKYKVATGKEWGSTSKSKDTTKANDDALKAQREYNKKLEDDAVQAELTRRQAVIDAMDEGLQKEQAQNKLNYDSNMEQLRQQSQNMVAELKKMKEKEWEAKNPNGTEKQKQAYLAQFSENDLPESQKKQLELYAQIYKDTYERANQESLDKALQDVATYTQKRKKLEEDAAKEIANMYDAETGQFQEGFSQANVDVVNDALKEELRQLDETQAAKSAEYEIFCNSLTDKTLGQLRKMLIQAKTAIEEAEGNIGASETELATKRAELAKLIELIKKLEAEQNFAETDSGEIATRTKKQWNDVSNTLKDCVSSLQEIGDVIGDTIAGQFIETATSITTTTITMVENINTLVKWSTKAEELAAEGASEAIQSVEKASVILAVISAAFQLTKSLNQWTKKGVSETEEKVKKHTRTINTLEKAYSDLGNQIEKAFGDSKVDLLNQQAINLAQQMAELRMAEIEELDQKGLSESEKEDIHDQYQSEIDDIMREINDLKSATEEAIFGNSIQDAIEDLADGLAEAWESGEDASKSFANFAKDQVKQALNAMLKDYISNANYAEKIRERIEEARRNDGQISKDEWEAILAYAEELGNQAVADTEWMQELYNKITESTRSGSNTGIATASQDSVNELNGRATAIQGHTYSIAENTRIITSNTSAILNSVRGIESDVAAMRARMDNMAGDVAILRRGTSDVKTQGLKIK